MFEDFRRERFIKNTLHKLAKQRVAMILQPGNVWVVEKAVSEGESDKVVAALRTCNLRGWVEVHTDAVPHGKLTPEGTLPEGLPMPSIAPVYKLTEAGWNVIHRSHEWIIATFVVVAITLIATIISILIANVIE